MPDPNKKISSPSLDACERNVLCTGAITTDADKDIIPIEECMNPCIVKEPKKDKTSAKATDKIKDTSVQDVKDDTAGKSGKEKQAVLNKEPCPPSPACEMARPESSNAKARVDNAKPGCVDFETCEDDEDIQEEQKQVSGCLNYEDCKDLAAEEKRILKERKEIMKQKKKTPVKPEDHVKPCPKK